jgi:hypothetical protein
MALAMDELNERGKTQNIGMAEAIDGSWAPIIDDEGVQRDSTTSPHGPRMTSCGYMGSCWRNRCMTCSI